MTMGRSSRKGSIGAPKFLDKSVGFYCRLEEPSARGGGEGEGEEGQREKAEDFSEGRMGDDGETLLQRKASRRRSSARWRQSSRRKQREAEGDPAGEQGPGGVKAEAPGCQEVAIQVAADEEERAGGDGEPALVHFPTQEEADDRVLIRHMKRGRDGEGEEERRAAREQEEGMKMVKRMTAKNYRKVSVHLGSARPSRRSCQCTNLHKFQIKIAG